MNMQQLTMQEIEQVSGGVGASKSIGNTYGSAYASNYGSAASSSAEVDSSQSGVIGTSASSNLLLSY